VATRKDKTDEILAILQEKKGLANFGELFLVMSERHGLKKVAFKGCLDDLRTAGIIDYPPLYMAMNEDAVLIKLTEKREYPR
jgi:hypothetical protein